MATQVTANRFGTTRTDVGLWKDAASSTVGAGFRATSNQNNITLNTSSGAQATITPTSVKASISVANIEVKTTKPVGFFSGYFKAEALSASVHGGIEGDLAGKSSSVTDKGQAGSSNSGVTVASAGAEAHVAKTTVGGVFQLGPIKLDLSGTVGFGASATGSVEFGKKSFGLSGSLGLGPTLGGGVKISWDTDALDNAIQKATPTPQPQVTQAAPALRVPISSLSAPAPVAAPSQSQSWVDHKLADSGSSTASPAVAPIAGRARIAQM